MNTSFGLKLALAAGGLLLVSACASLKPTGPDLSGNSTGAGGAGSSVSAVTPGSQADLEQNVGHRVFFGYDQYTLSPQAQATLQRQADSQRQADTWHRVAQLALGARRAEAARSFLVSRGVDGSRISTVSYGKERPMDPRSTEDAWSMNRNATTTLVSAGA